MEIGYLEEKMKQSENAKKYKKAIQLFSENNSDETKKEAIELFLETAVNGYVPSMDVMAYLCHDNRAGLYTQDRRQECFWFYSLKDPSPEVAKRLEKVEAVLGLR